jgi:pectate lyase
VTRATLTILVALACLRTLAAWSSPPRGSLLDVVVSTTQEFRAALSAAGPGTTISVNSGVYAGGSYRNGIAGTAEAPVVIQAADPARPPVFAGGDNGLQLSNARHVTLRDLIFERAGQNGINIDDGETFETPSHHIGIERVIVRDLPAGNRDGIKLSGVTDFVIEDSTVERWGDGGSAVDMVGCHRGVIRGSLFRHTPGSTRITITGNRFEHAAARAVQIGGVTSLRLFRPQPPGRAEASGILVERNVFIGGQTAVAFVGSDGGVFRFNTVYLSTTWPIRILQEHTAPGLVPSRRGEFTDNIVHWRGPEVGVNVGANTDPASFIFARNRWYREDAPDSSRLPLPGVETDGVYGVDPGFVAPPIDLRTRGDLAAGAYASR